MLALHFSKRNNKYSQYKVKNLRSEAKLFDLAVNATVTELQCKIGVLRGIFSRQNPGIEFLHKISLELNSCV